jgi:hypothetical protein
MFRPLSAELHSKGDVVGEKVFRFLGAVTGLMPTVQSTEQPFRPQLIEKTRRSTALENFDEGNTITPGQLAAVAKDSELRARFADVACSKRLPPHIFPITLVCSLDDRLRMWGDRISHADSPSQRQDALPGCLLR